MKKRYWKSFFALGLITTMTLSGISKPVLMAKAEENVFQKEVSFQERIQFITEVIPRYSSVKLKFNPVQGISKYIIYRSEEKNGNYTKVGSTSDSTYIDQTQTGKTYFYQIKSEDGTIISEPVGTTMPTGIEAMKTNAVIFQDLSNQVFDGNKIVDVSDKAEEVGKLANGAVIVKFKTTDKSSYLTMLVGKRKGESIKLYSDVNKAAFYLYNSAMRADFAHTRANSSEAGYNDGEWHTAMIIQADSGYVFSIVVDGVERGKWQGDANKGFFSKLKNLDKLTIGGYYNGNTTVISDGFKGELAYVAITDEVNTIEEAKAITLSETGKVISDLTENMFDQSKDNTWVFSGGIDVAGGYEQVQGFRNYIGQFEEYVRWTKNGGIPGRQRYTINTGKAGNTIKNIDEQFDNLVAKYDPRALAVMVGEEDYLAGADGLVKFKETLTHLAEKALTLRNNTGYLVIQTPYAQADESRNTLAATYTEAIKEAVDSLTDEQKAKIVVVNHFIQTNNNEFKTNKLDEQGHLNALGHLQIAKEFSKATYGSVNGFPVSEASLNLQKTAVPETHLAQAPVIIAEDTQLKVMIPENIKDMAPVWKYDLEIANQTITGEFRENQAIIEELEKDSIYTLTVTSEDGKIQLAVVTGIVRQGDESVIKPVIQTELTELQQQVKAITERSEPATWLFVGDSITHGALHTKGYDSIHQIFEKYIRDELGRKDDVVINTAVSGATTREQEANSNERLDKYDADVVIVMLGTNDASNAMVPLNEYEKNLKSIVDKIHSKGAVAILRTPNPLRPENGNRATNLPKYSEVIRRVATEKNAILVDHFAEWSQKLETKSYLWNNGYWNNDSIHPNPNGQLDMAQSLIRGCGLFNEASTICNLAYKLPNTVENSENAIHATAEGNRITVDMKALESSYGHTFGTAEIKAVSDGKTYSSKVVKGESVLSLQELPLNKSYQVTVTADLLDSSKTVIFKTETVELIGEVKIYTVRFLDKDGNE